MKTLGRALLSIALLGAVFAVAVYKHPLWVDLQTTHARLLFSRVQSNYVLTPEGRVHYYEAEPGIPGGGTPLVLIHGLADRDESWAPMLVRLKRAGFHVYAPDLLGYGRSPHPESSDYSIATQEQFVAHFIQSLGLQKPDVGGWSMGGWVVLKLALDRPDMIDRVVVYDSAGLLFEHKETAAVFHPTDGPGVDRMIALLAPDIKPLRPFERRDVLRTMQVNQWVVDRSVASMSSGKDLLDDRLSHITQPLLILWGADDHLIPLASGQKMHDLVPSSELDVLEGCGHLAPKVCSSRAAAATADFLRSNPPAAGTVRTLTAMH